jgi:hypothetical protein
MESKVTRERQFIMPTGLQRRLVWHMVGFGVVALFLPSVTAQDASIPALPSGPTLADQRVAVLNRLRNDINSTYGFREGMPRINLGPCGRFARDFRERWNARFSDKVNIVFVMTGDRTHCHHVMVRLPDGNYYDGGNGVITERSLLNLFPGGRLDEMKEFNPKLLDKWSYGLGRSYPICPNYSDATTTRLIDQRLAELPKTG